MAVSGCEGRGEQDTPLSWPFVLSGVLGALPHPDTRKNALDLNALDLLPDCSISCWWWNFLEFPA
jgi:hypothetical protein